MTTCLRSPNGVVHRVPHDKNLFEIGCDRPLESAGQWIVYCDASDARIIGGIWNGASLESVGESLVFTSRLDEVGEEFLLLLRTDRLLLVRLRLTTQKLELADYYILLKEYDLLFGAPIAGPATVAGRPATGIGRAALADEASFRLVRQAVEFAGCCKEVERDIPKHLRGRSGVAGVDALRTLAAWKTKRSWYRRAEQHEASAVNCGGDRYVVPLRTVPRSAAGGNKFLGAVIQELRGLIELLPRSAGGRMTASILQHGERVLARLDTVASVSRSEGRRILSAKNLPVCSRKVALLLKEAEDVARLKWNLETNEAGDVPYFLPVPEAVFQMSAVASVLMGLGAPADEVEVLYSIARGAAGGQIGSEYVVWVDTPLHGLQGWRATSQLPSGYRPDLIIRRQADGAWLIADAKLRGGDQLGRLLPQSGVKELQAYMQEYGLRKGVLLVPGKAGNGWTSEDVKGDGCHIRAIAIPPDDLAGRAEFGRRLLEEMWDAVGR